MCRATINHIKGTFVNLVSCILSRVSTLPFLRNPCRVPEEKEHDTIVWHMPRAPAALPGPRDRVVQDEVREQRTQPAVCTERH